MYVTQAYPRMKPYLKGFHLSLETWQGERDKEGWKVPAKAMQAGVIEEEGLAAMSNVKLLLLTQTTEGWDVFALCPQAGFTLLAPQFREDLEALLSLAEGKKPAKHCIRSIRAHTAFYGFGDASSLGFGATVEQPDGLHGRFGLWGRDEEGSSSKDRELQNLVETVEEEAAVGYLAHGKLWIFTNNLMFGSCFFWGRSSSKLLHKLVLRL